MKNPQVYKLIEFLPLDQRTNATSHINDYEDSIVIIRLVQASTTLFANFFIIILYHLMSKTRKNVSNYLLFCQAISDSYIGIIMCVEVILHYLVKSGYWYDRLSLMYTAMLEYSFTLSIGILFMCVMERYLTVNNPICHKQKITKPRVVLGAALVCVMSFGPPSCLLVLMDFQLINSINNAVVVYSLSFNTALFLLIISIIIILARTLRNARKAIRPKIIDTLPLNKYRVTIRENSEKTRQRRETRLLKIFIIMIVAYAVTYSPIILARFVYDTGILDGLNSYHNMIIISLCQTLYKSSALCNPMITMILKRDYRRKFNNTLKHRRSFSSTIDSQRFYVYTTYV